jgi:hypothetical protein
MKKKFKFIIFDMKLLNNSYLNFFFSPEIYSNATNENMILKIIQ